jgi:hypothetical protein
MRRDDGDARAELNKFQLWHLSPIKNCSEWQFNYSLGVAHAAAASISRSASTKCSFHVREIRNAQSVAHALLYLIYITQSAFTIDLVFAWKKFVRADVHSGFSWFSVHLLLCCSCRCGISTFMSLLRTHNVANKGRCRTLISLSRLIYMNVNGARLHTDKTECGFSFPLFCLFCESAAFSIRILTRYKTESLIEHNAVRAIIYYFVSLVNW